MVASVAGAALVVAALVVAEREAMATHAERIGAPQ